MKANGETEEGASVEGTRRNPDDLNMDSRSFLSALQRLTTARFTWKIVIVCFLEIDKTTKKKDSRVLVSPRIEVIESKLFHWQDMK